MVLGFNMLDLIKVIIIILGLNFDGWFEDWGILVSIVLKYLVEYGVVIEKIGFYSFFVMFIIGIIKGCWNMLLVLL